MSHEDPMSLFSKSLSKKAIKQPTKKQESETREQVISVNPEPKEPFNYSFPKSEQIDESEGILPSNWRERVDKMCYELQTLREQAKKIPQNHNLSEHEFEAYMNNSDNFSPQEWELIEHARAKAKRFLQQMKEIISQCQLPPAKPKKRRGISRGWINVD